MIVGSRLTEVQADNLAAAFEEMPRMLEAYDDGRDEGRREMLWLVAVGAAFASDDCYDEATTSGPTNAAHWTTQSFVYDDVRRAALRALADLGDERAREMLR